MEEGGQAVSYGTMLDGYRLGSEGGCHLQNGWSRYVQPRACCSSLEPNWSKRQSLASHGLRLSLILSAKKQSLSLLHARQDFGGLVSPKQHRPIH